MQTHPDPSADDVPAEEDEDAHDDGLLRPWWLDDPEFLADMERQARREKVIWALVSPLSHLPYVGRLVSSFWFDLLDEGVYQTCKPRWGTITYSFLNDGFSPTLWHTWKQMGRTAGFGTTARRGTRSTPNASWRATPRSARGTPPTANANRVDGAPPLRETHITHAGGRGGEAEQGVTGWTMIAVRTTSRRYSTGSRARSGGTPSSSASWR
jgi:hypothetical protein